MIRPRRVQAAGGLNLARHRLIFQARALTSDGYGGAEGEWADQFTRQAAMEPRFGGEQITAARLAGVQPFTVTVRQDSKTRTLTTAWRVKHARTGVLYDITAIADPDGAGPQAGQFLDLLVQTGSEK